MGMISSKVCRRRYSSIRGKRLPLLFAGPRPRNRSILLSRRNDGVFDFFTNSRTNSSEGSRLRAASTITRTSAQPAMASRTSVIIFRPSELSGRWTPGVSMRTTCPPDLFFFLGTCRIPRMRLRVVCGLGLMMASFSPTNAFSSVDLPALGRPRMQTKPEWKDMGPRDERDSPKHRGSGRSGTQQTISVSFVWAGM